MRTVRVARTGRPSQRRAGLRGRAGCSCARPHPLAALAALATAEAAVFALVAHPGVTRWGSTERERRAAWPGDDLVADPAFVWTNAVSVERSAEHVWPWLARLGQGRGGLYSYDWLENLAGCDVHSTDRVLPQFQQPLAVADRVIQMCRYAPHNPVARFEPGRALVLGHVKDSAADLAAGHARSTWAFIVDPVGPHGSRLIVRSRGSSLAARLQGPVQFVMQRRTMLGIKHRAESTPASTADELEPLLWLLTGSVFVIASLTAAVRRERRRRPLVVAVGAGATLPAVMFARHRPGSHPPVG